MEYVMGLVTNKVLLSAVAAWFVAQGSKIILDVIKGTFTFKRLSGGGGMPSAHSATVIGLTTATAIVYGTGGGQRSIYALQQGTDDRQAKTRADGRYQKNTQFFDGAGINHLPAI